MRPLLDRLAKSFRSRPRFSTGGAPSFDFSFSSSRPDVHEFYRTARAQSPVCFDASLGEWYVLSYDEAVWAFKNPQILSSKYTESFDPLVVGNDPPEHTAYRKILGRAMAGCDAAMVESYTANWMQAFLEKTAGNGGAFEVVGDLACPLPEQFTGHMLGLSKLETETLMAMRPSNRTQLNESWPDVTAYLSQLVSAANDRDPSTVFGALKSLGVPDALSDDEITGLLRLLWFAGTSTSTHFLPSLILLMLKNSDLAEKLSADKALLAGFVNEALRMEGPTGVLPRKALQDFELAGVKIPANAMVKICILAANSDPSVFPQPREFRFDRTVTSVAFGHGIHFCLGAMIAKTMAIGVASALASRLPAMRADQPLDEVPYEPSDAFRSIRRLRVRLC
ncbi:MAG: cytochrome P450 [Chthoniobacterales bacterium]|nr:cytochrome P450 [Chthoniobacterales bacterium]